MWWVYKKEAEDEHTVVYSYSWEDRTYSGELWHNKDTGETKITKFSLKDEPKYSEAVEQFYRLIKEGYPDDKIVAIG